MPPKAPEPAESHQRQRRMMHDLIRDGSLAEIRKELTLDPTVVSKTVNHDLQTILFYAALREEGALDVTRLLLEQKANPLHQDKLGQTALFYFAKTANVECASLLVNRGCKVNQMDNLVDQTPIFYAARYGPPAMVRRLAELRADVWQRDRLGNTPLFWAGSAEVCETMLQIALWGVRSGIGGVPGGDQVIAVCNPRDAVQRTIEKLATSGPSDRSQEIVRYLQACMEVKSLKGHASWSTIRIAARASTADEQPASPRAAASGVMGYVTSLAKPRDVDQLCALEDEFIEDHRGIIAKPSSEVDFFSQIGLNRSAVARRTTVQNIAKSSPRTGATRHCTLKCLCLPPNVKNLSGSARSRCFQVVGYVYFRIYEGGAQKDDDSDSGSGIYKPDVAHGHVVVSHLKVSREHQRRGVATLLLTGMLQIVENERQGDSSIQSLHLSVNGENLKAFNLYERLGFAATEDERPGKKGWVQMQLQMPQRPNSIKQVQTNWLRRVNGAAGCPEHLIELGSIGGAAGSDAHRGKQPGRQVQKRPSEASYEPRRKLRGPGNPPSPSGSAVSNASTFAESGVGARRDHDTETTSSFDTTASGSTAARSSALRPMRPSSAYPIGIGLHY